MIQKVLDRYTMNCQLMEPSGPAGPHCRPRWILSEVAGGSAPGPYAFLGHDDTNHQCMAVATDMLRHHQGHPVGMTFGCQGQAPSLSSPSGYYTAQHFNSYRSPVNGTVFLAAIIRK